MLSRETMAGIAGLIAKDLRDNFGENNLKNVQANLYLERMPNTSPMFSCRAYEFYQDGFDKECKPGESAYVLVLPVITTGEERDGVQEQSE